MGYHGEQWMRKENRGFGVSWSRFKHNVDDQVCPLGTTAAEPNFHQTLPVAPCHNSSPLSFNLAVNLMRANIYPSKRDRSVSVVGCKVHKHVPYYVFKQSYIVGSWNCRVERRTIIIVFVSICRTLIVRTVSTIIASTQ